MEAEARLGLRPLDRGVDLDRREAARDPKEPAHHLGDLALEAVIRGKLDEPRPRERIPDPRGEMPYKLARGEERLDPRGHERGRGLEELRYVVAQLLLVVRRVPLLLQALQGEQDPRVQPRRIVVRKAQVDRDLVGGPEAYPVDLACHSVGLGREDGLRLRPVLLHHLDALAWGDPVRLQEDVELALRALAVPGLLDRRGPLAADALDVAQAARLLAQDPEGVGPERVDDLVRVHPADPRDEAAPQVLADAVDARGQLALEGADLELGAVLGMLGPFAGEVERLAALDARQRPHDRHRLGLRPVRPAVRTEFRDGIVVLLVEEDDALEDSGERGGFGGCGHGRAVPLRWSRTPRKSTPQVLRR